MAAAVIASRRLRKLVIPTRAVEHDIDEELSAAMVNACAEGKDHSEAQPKLMDGPVNISPELLIGKMPRPGKILKQGFLHKLTSSYDWKPMNAVLTCAGLYLSRPDEDALRDLIPLYEIVDIKKRNDLPGEMRQKKKSEHDPLRETQLRAQGSLRNMKLMAFFEHTEKPLFVLQVRTMENGYNSGRTYYFDADSEETCNEWLLALRTESDRAVLLKRAGPSFLDKVQFRLRQFYRWKIVQGGTALLIFISFIINIVQTELTGQDGSGVHSYDETFVVVEYFFTAIFFVELLINFGAHFFWPFIQDPWNCFDAVVVIVSLVSLFLSFPGVTALRLVRTIRVLRLFGRLSSLRQIVSSLSASVYPGAPVISISLFSFMCLLIRAHGELLFLFVVSLVANAFCMMGIVMAIFSVVGFDLFGEVDFENFGTFSRSYFTMFQVCTGDAWASNIARPLYIDSSQNIHSHVPLFFVSFIVLVAWTLLQVVVAVLLDSFMNAAIQEKERQQASLLEKQGKGVDGSVLDPLIAVLVQFESLAGLNKRIKELFEILDVDDSKAISYIELREGFKKLNLQPGIVFSPEDFDEFTNSRELTNDRGELSVKEFGQAMRKQMMKFVQNKMTEAMRMTNQAQATSMFFVMKILTLSIEEVNTTEYARHHIGRRASLTVGAPPPNSALAALDKQRSVDPEVSLLPPGTSAKERWPTGRRGGRASVRADGDWKAKRRGWLVVTPTDRATPRRAAASHQHLPQDVDISGQAGFPLGQAEASTAEPSAALVRGSSAPSEINSTRQLGGISLDSVALPSSSSRTTDSMIRAASWEGGERRVVRFAEPKAGPTAICDAETLFAPLVFAEKSSAAVMDPSPNSISQEASFVAGRSTSSGVAGNAGAGGEEAVIMQTLPPLWASPARTRRLSPRPPSPGSSSEDARPEGCSRGDGPWTDSFRPPLRRRWGGGAIALRRLAVRSRGGRRESGAARLGRMMRQHAREAWSWRQATTRRLGALQEQLHSIFAAMPNHPAGSPPAHSGLESCSPAPSTASR